MLRGINVSGQRMIKMADLKALYSSLGLNDVETYIQSGNVVFHASNVDAKRLSATIEHALMKQFGYPVSVFVRNKTEFKNIIGNNPFLKQKNIDLAKLHVTFLAQQPLGKIIEDLYRIEYGSDQFVSYGREIYLHCPGGYGKTKLNNHFFEIKLSVKATTRNWNTVTTLYEMATNI